MKLCEHDCYPCCDFCIHVWHEIWQDDNGGLHKGGPCGCGLHIDAEHKEITEACSHCDDFHCFLADKT